MRGAEDTCETLAPLKIDASLPSSPQCSSAKVSLRPAQRQPLPTEFPETDGTKVSSRFRCKIWRRSKLDSPYLIPTNKRRRSCLQGVPGNFGAAQSQRCPTDFPQTNGAKVSSRFHCKLRRHSKLAPPYLIPTNKRRRSSLQGFPANSGAAQRQLHTT